MKLITDKNLIFIQDLINTRKGIFWILIVGKIILIPFLLYVASKVDPRPFNILILPDLVRYEDSQRLLNLFNTESWSPSIGFMSLAALIKLFSSTELMKYITYGLFSLFIMTYAQTLLLFKLFEVKKDSLFIFKLFSIILSTINFYILIYSVKPSTDVFGCLAIVILFIGILKFDKEENYKGALLWIISLLFLSLFRSNLFIVLPFLVFTNSFKLIIKDLKNLSKGHKLLILSLIAFLLILNLYQFLGYLVLYENDQKSGGIVLNFLNDNSKNTANKIFNLVLIFFRKIIYLISAREAIAINNYNFLIAQNTSLFNYPFLLNSLTALYLLFTNFLGLIAINTRFKLCFRNAFLFTLIPLIPLLSYWTHHRYFLAYSLFTNACLPFIFEKNIYIKKV